MTAVLRRRVRGTAVLATVLAIVAASCSMAGGESPEELTIGVGSTREQRVLAALAVAAFERAGVPTTLREDLGGTQGVRRAALRDRIDLYWGYTGAAWTLGLFEEAPAAEAAESFARIREADASNGLSWLSPTEADATLALFVRRIVLPPAQEPGGLTWLAGELSAGDRTLCARGDFLDREGGLAALARAYQIDTSDLATRRTPPEEAIAAVAAGECFAGLATATSGEARTNGLAPLRDGLSVFPAFIVAPVRRDGAPVSAERIEAALAPVTSTLDTTALGRLNARVAAGQPAREVAQAYLDEVAPSHAADRTTP